VTPFALAGEAADGGDATIQLVELFVLLIAAATVVALVTRRSALPYSVALVLLGLAIAAFGPTVPLEVTPELVLIVLVPGLVFEAAYKLDFAELRRTYIGVAVLAIPGVLVSAGVVAIVLTLAGLPPSLAFIVGAIVSATDPVSVIATFKRLGAPKRLATLVEAESLFNDGTAVVVFSIAVAAATGPIDPSNAVLWFSSTLIVSAGLGLVTGVVATRLMAIAGDHLLELAISVVLAYGTYLIADGIGQSGIIATVVAGLVLGTYGRRVGLREATFDALDLTWEFGAFLLTAFVFLLIGLAISITALVESAGLIVVGVIGILVGRALVVYPILGGGSRVVHALGHGSLVPTAWLHVLFWAGLRGAIAVGLALSLPADIPQRDELQAIVFGITLFTLLVQGATSGFLLRRLGLQTAPADNPDAPTDASDAPAA
jgi:monovalent cation:H+ antiporter, CPA1 family